MRSATTPRMMQASVQPQYIPVANQDEAFDDTEDDKRPVFGHLGDEKQVDRPGEQRRRSRHPEREHRVGSEEYASHHHEHEIERREDAGCHEVAGSEPFVPCCSIFVLSN